MLKDSYDVVIVGCGPAGLSSAKRCREHGLSVCVLEDHPAIGVPVQCGESLIASVLDDIGLETEEGWAYYGNRAMKMVSPSGKVAELRLHSKEARFVAILDRKLFEKKWAVQVANAGADIFVNTPVTDVIKEGSQVVGVKVDWFGKTREIRAKLVIAADGPTSGIGRKAGLPISRAMSNTATCAQFQMANIDIDPNTCELYFGEMAPKFGLWVLPKGKGFANVGLGIPADSPKSAIQYLMEFVEKDPRLSGGSIIEYNVGPVPVAGLAEKIYAPGLLLVGDAAGMVNEFSGGGIKFAIEGGILAANAAAAAIAAGDLSEKGLASYQDAWKKKFERRFKGFRAFKEIFHNAKPEEIDKLCEDLGKIELQDLDKRTDIAYILLSKVLPTFLKRPKWALKLGKAAIWFK